MRKVVMVVLFLCVAVSRVLANDALPCDGKEGWSVGVGGATNGLVFTPDQVRTVFEAKLKAAYVGVAWQTKNFSLGLDVGGAEMGLDKVFMNGSDFADQALFLRPTLKAATELTETFRLGGTFSYAYVGKIADWQNERFANWRGQEKISLDSSHVFTVSAPVLQWQPLKKTALYAGFTSRFIELGNAHIKLSAPLYGHDSFTAKLRAKDSFGATVGASYGFARWELSLQGQALSNNGSGLGGELAYRF